MAWIYAQLNNDDLQRIRELEDEIGVILIAYRDEFGPDVDTGSLLNVWTEQLNWESSKRDRP